MNGTPPSPDPPRAVPGAPSPHASYRAPQETYRPLCALAVVALVLACAFLLPALLGPWWVEAVPATLAILAWRRTRRRPLRGRGLAVAAVAVSVTVGALALLMQRQFGETAEERFDAIARALDGGKPEDVAKWVSREADAEKEIAAWIARMRSAREAAGPYRRFSVGSLAWGTMIPLVVRPRNLGEELAPRGGSEPAPGGTFWATAEFERGRLWFAFVVAKGDGLQDALRALAEGESRGDPHFVRDVRIYREASDAP